MYEEYRARVMADRERLRESLRQLESAPADGAIQPAVPRALLASPAALYSLASDSLKRELVMLLTERRIVIKGEPSVVAKQAPLEAESDARWYVTIAMKVWGSDIASSKRNASAYFAHSIPTT